MSPPAPKLWLRHWSRAGSGREYSDFSLKYERTRSTRCARSARNQGHHQPIRGAKAGHHRPSGAPSIYQRHHRTVRGTTGLARLPPSSTYGTHISGHPRSSRHTTILSEAPSTNQEHRRPMYHTLPLIDGAASACQGHHRLIRFTTDPLGVLPTYQKHYRPMRERDTTDLSGSAQAMN